MDMLGGQRVKNVEWCWWDAWEYLATAWHGENRHWRESLAGGVISDSWETSVVSWSGSIGARCLARTRASSPVRCLTSRGRDQPSA